MREAGLADSQLEESLRQLTQINSPCPTKSSISPFVSTTPPAKPRRWRKTDAKLVEVTRKNSENSERVGWITAGARMSVRQINITQSCTAQQDVRIKEKTRQRRTSAFGA